MLILRMIGENRGHDMRYEFGEGFKSWVIIVGIFSVVLGCASTSNNHEPLLGEGFQSSLPKPGARVVVWGNHSGAVTRTLKWLQDHQIQGVDPSLVEKELTDPRFDHRTRMKQKAQVLAAARSLGASLVIFAYREDVQYGQEFNFMSFGYKRTKVIAIEIRGIKTETREVAFGAKAWNPGLRVETEQLVQNITTLALQKAWNESESPASLQPEVIPQEVAQQTPQREQVRVVSSNSDKMSTEPEAGKTENVDLPSSEEESSLGLQIAGGALSVIYTPLKVVYAGLGGFMGGLAYLLTAGNEQVAQSIWDASVNGTYWLTARHLQGEEAIYFKGESSRVDPANQPLLDEAMTVGAIAE